MSAWREVGPGRLGRRNTIVGFGVIFALLVGAGAGVAALIASNRMPARCAPYRPCGPLHLARPLVDEQVWRSPQFGFTVLYPASMLSVSSQSPARVQLSTSDGQVLLTITGRAASQASPPAAVAAELSGLQSTVSGLATDTASADALLGANVGYRAGSGSVYSGTLAGPLGLSEPSSVAIQAASDGQVTISATVQTQATDQHARKGAFQLADAVFNTVQWEPGR